MFSLTKKIKGMQLETWAQSWVWGCIAATLARAETRPNSKECSYVKGSACWGALWNSWVWKCLLAGLRLQTVAPSLWVCIYTCMCVCRVGPVLYSPPSLLWYLTQDFSLSDVLPTTLLEWMSWVVTILKWTPVPGQLAVCTGQGVLGCERHPVHRGTSWVPHQDWDELHGCHWSCPEYPFMSAKS